MNRIAIAGAVLCLASVAVAEDKKMGMDKGMKHGEMAANPSTAYTPKQVTKEDKKGLDAFYNAMQEGWKKQDINAVAAMVDFPVMMVTDDHKGVVTSTTWTRDQWISAMTEQMKNMPKDMPMPKIKRDYFFITDTIAAVQESHTMKMGNKSMKIHSHGLAIQKDGKWMVKSMVEGGWGDAMKPTQQGAAAGMK